jgi:hypothetical protein
VALDAIAMDMVDACERAADRLPGRVSERVLQRNEWLVKKYSLTQQLNFQQGSSPSSMNQHNHLTIVGIIAVI